MADNVLRVPYPLSDWRELNRRTRDLSGDYLEHVTADDPHTQYLLETDALEVFSFAAYGGMYTAAPRAMANFGLNFETLPFDALAVAQPRGVHIDTTLHTFRIEQDGIFLITVVGSLAHDSAQGGREFNFRIWHVALGQPTAHDFRVFTGRNADGTNFSLTALVEITEALKGETFRAEIGGTTDTYSSMDFDGELNISSVGEWREPLPSADPP